MSKFGKPIWMKACRKSADFVEKWKGEDWCDEMEHDYYDVVKSVLRDWLGVHGGDAIDGFFDQACCGNWAKIHETDDEKKQTISELVHDLVDEIFYCLDRWTWDRILRTHWIYQRIKFREKYGWRNGPLAQ